MVDIIIPTYQNEKGLIWTLASIDYNNPNFHVTVIDDCSKEKWKKAEQLFPTVTFLYSQNNMGPGMARQLGIEYTNEPYLMFIDTDDYVINPEMFDEIIQTINNHPEVDMFSWKHITDKSKEIQPEAHNRMHGRIYKREFLNKYGLHFYEDSSRANEDVGFNRLCRLIFKQLERKGEPNHMLVIEKPLIVWTQDPTSITNKNGGEFIYKAQNLGLAKSEIHVVENAKRLGIDRDLIEVEVNEIMSTEYYFFLITCQERDEFMQEAWNGAKLFYNTVFKDYETKDFNTFNLSFAIWIKIIRKRMIQRHWRKHISVNARRFLQELIKFDSPPEYYKG